MLKRNHASKAAAIGELRAHGYEPIGQNPELGVQPYRRPKNPSGPTFAVARESRPRSTVWHIVRYPQ